MELFSKHDLFIKNLMVVLVLSIWSCQKAPDSPKTTLRVDSSIVVSNGILRFPSYGAFLHVQRQLREERSVLPQNFRSLYDAYHEVVISENDHQDKYLAATKEEKVHYPQHSEAYLEALRNGSIYEYVELYGGETYTTYGCNSFSHSVIKLLNPQGLVMVGDTVIQYKHDKRKFMVGKNLNFDNLDKIIDAVETDEEQGIWVYNVKTISHSEGAQERTIPDFIRECQVNNGDANSNKWTRKVVTKMTHFTTFDPFYGAWIIDFDVWVYAERKATFGPGWNPTLATLQLVCSSTSDVGFDSFDSGSVPNVQLVAVNLLPHGAYSFLDWPVGAPNLLSASATGTIWSTNPSMSCTITFP